MTKLTGLTAMNVRALREVAADLALEVTATTATFPGTPEEATAALRERLVELNLKGYQAKRHPIASLRAVIRKLERAEAVN